MPSTTDGTDAYAVTKILPTTSDVTNVSLTTTGNTSNVTTTTPTKASEMKDVTTTVVVLTDSGNKF